MIALIKKDTGEVLEAQSSPVEGAMISNSPLLYGLSVEDVVEVECSLEQIENGYLWVNGEWLPNLEVSKKKKREEINILRNKAEVASPFIYLGKEFDYDSKSRERIDKAISVAITALVSQQSFTVDWALADNSVITLSAQDLAGFPVAEATRSWTLHAKARALKDLVDAATTVEEVNAISWED